MMRSKYKRREDVTQRRGQQLAHELYPDMDNCEMCDKPAYDIHHKDKNRLNNNRSNVMFLCRKHHMEIDGRLEILKQNGIISGKLQKVGLRPCVNCRIPAYPLRKGRCHACNEYYRRNNKERVVLQSGDTITKLCPICGEYFILDNIRTTYCKPCYKERKRERHMLYERERRANLKNV